ncbi:MAG: 2-dehydropantoate 2-reductase [Chloroflexota bacterium]|nr:2-dehydropantoate 2-reductase [Chloroflexota bacterium]
MRFLVLGAGAIGSVFGGFLALNGHQVTIVGRKPHIDVIRGEGLHISGIWGDHQIQIPNAVEDLHNLSELEFDIIFISVKSYDTPAAVRDILPIIRPNTIVVSLQNGIGNIETIAQQIGWERTAGARVIFGSTHLAPGEIRVTVYAEEVMIGTRYSAIEDKRIIHLAQVLSDSGIPTLHTHQIDQFLWSKLLYNCALNPLATILHCHYGLLGESDHTKSIIGAVVSEIFNVAQSNGMSLFWDKAEDYIHMLFEKLLPATYEHQPSMLQDIIKGKRSEIDAMNGAVCRMGEQLGVHTPVNLTLTQLIKTIEHTPNSTPISTQ